MIASYSRVVENIALNPVKFVGHGWLYAYGGNDLNEIAILKEHKETFNAPDVEKKKPRTVLFRKPNQSGSDKSPPRRKGCCGGRK
jgi:hypothetical protein|tara:strand:- start:190 stop:444 length:255 start_codon:yes stop_codon:yes gene_type:complete